MTDVRLEGLTLRVAQVKRSMEFYGGKLGFAVEIGSVSMTSEQRAGIHVELTTDNLDALYEHLKARGVVFFEPPHEEPWERSMKDPDGYTIEFAEGRRGHRGVT